jgi:uncharacterized protein (DUF433 family)
MVASFDKEVVMPQLDRITQQPEVMGGKACIRGMRVTVGMLVGQIGAGHSVDDVLADYPYIERADIMQALQYAAWRAEEREITLASADRRTHATLKANSQVLDAERGSAGADSQCQRCLRQECICRAG